MPRSIFCLLWKNFKWQERLHICKCEIFATWIPSDNVYSLSAFHRILVTWFLVVFGKEVTKRLRNSLFTLFTEQGKTGLTDI